MRKFRVRECTFDTFGRAPSGLPGVVLYVNTHGIEPFGERAAFAGLPCGSVFAGSGWAGRGFVLFTYLRRSQWCPMTSISHPFETGATDTISSQAD